MSRITYFTEYYCLVLVPWHKLLTCVSSTILNFNGYILSQCTINQLKADTNYSTVLTDSVGWLGELKFSNCIIQENEFSLISSYACSSWWQ